MYATECAIAEKLIVDFINDLEFFRIDIRRKQPGRMIDGDAALVLLTSATGSRRTP